MKPSGVVAFPAEPPLSQGAVAGSPSPAAPPLHDLTDAPLDTWPGGPTPATLPCAPDRLLLRHGPAWGRHAGRLQALDWRGHAATEARSALWRRLRHKRWHYIGLHAHPLFIGLAVVDVGWCCTAFAYVFERGRGLRADVRRDALPGLARVSAAVGGAGSHLAAPGAAWSITPEPGGLGVQVRARGLALQASIDLGGGVSVGRGADPGVGMSEVQAEPVHLTRAGRPWLLAVGTVGSGQPHATQKSPALPLRGELRLGAQVHRLDGGVASIDSSAGYLPRRTAWRWAHAQRPGLGFNLQAGYFGDQENALWLDDALIPLGAARFQFDAAQPLQPWHITTDDGLLDLRFTPEGARAEDRHLLLAASHYVQPVGCFDGWVRAAPGAARRKVRQLVGITEDHRTRW